MFKRVVIIGLGLIGGSLGLAIKEKRIAKEIFGISRKAHTIHRALSLGIVDHASLNLKEGIKGAELIILAVPVLKIIDIGRRIAGVLPAGTIMIDVGSTKKDIARCIESVLPAGVNFVGSHPMTGSEKSGLSYVNKDLFKGAYCILTKTNRTKPEALNKIKKFWNKLGMKVELMSPAKHDKIVSRLSHLPHAASVGLSNTCGKRDLRLSSSGFGDATRIASGMPEMWKDIFITNRENISGDIRVLKKELSKIEAALERGNTGELLNLFKRAKFIRDSL